MPFGLRSGPVVHGLSVNRKETALSTWIVGNVDRYIRYIRFGTTRTDMPHARRFGDEASISDARQAFVRASTLVNVVAPLVTAVAAIAGCWVALQLTAPSVVQELTAGFVALVLSVPFGVAVTVRMRHLTSRAESLSDARQRRIDEDGQHQDFSSKVADALDMAGTEPEALRVIERAFVSVLPGQPVELLLADNSHAHLTRMAHTAPDGAPPGCEVASPQECPAARRSRVQHFPDSEAVNACPKLEGRAVGRCSALCIPVSVMGRTVGVIHTVSEVEAPTVPKAATDLQSVAAQAGTRLGMLRIMAETQLQATTDGLTGLMNRRALENGYLELRGSSTVTAVAMADLDHFKRLNDTFGHATGDRALRMFAQTLKTSLRTEDLVSRRGGEEFAVVFPDCTAAAAVSGLQRVQTQLQVALSQSGLPTYTASFGVVEANADEDFETTLDRADVALFAAKEGGRDRVTVHDQHGSETLYPATAFPESAAVARDRH